MHSFPADHNMEGLPEGWAITRLRDAYEINPPKASKDSLPPDTPVTFVPMPAVDAEEGAITRPQNGKAAIARDLINGLGFGSTEFHVLRPNGMALPEFVYHYIRQNSYRRLAEAEMTGSVGQKRVPQTFLETTELPVPPLPEQTRIVRTLTELLNTIRTSQEKLGQVPAILKRFRQTVLAAACSGRLTEDWRQQNLSLRPKFHTPVLDLPKENADLPEEWGVSTVEAVCEVIVDCPHSTPRWTTAGVRCVRTTNFKAGVLDLSDVRFVS